MSNKLQNTDKKKTFPVCFWNTGEQEKEKKLQERTLQNFLRYTKHKTESRQCIAKLSVLHKNEIDKHI